MDWHAGWNQHYAQLRIDAQESREVCPALFSSFASSPLVCNIPSCILSILGAACFYWFVPACLPPSQAIGGFYDSEPGDGWQRTSFHSPHQSLCPRRLASSRGFIAFREANRIAQHVLSGNVLCFDRGYS